MNAIAIYPRAGVDGLGFGVSRSVAQSHFGGWPGRTEMCLDGTLGDHWPDNGVTIYYGMDDRVKAIVLDYPASFKLNGFDLSDAKIEDAISFVRSLDPQVLVGECEVYSSKLCMSVCRSVSQNSTAVSLTLDSGENDEWWF